MTPLESSTAPDGERLGGDIFMKEMPHTPTCFVCGEAKLNKRTLGLKLFWDEATKQVVIPFVPDESWCGYEDMVHGGILAAIIDDAMARATKMESQDLYVTAKMELLFRKPVLLGKSYRACGKVTTRKGRKVFTEAEILDENDLPCVSATGLFVLVSQSKGETKTETI